MEIQMCGISPHGSAPFLRGPSHARSCVSKRFQVCRLRRCRCLRFPASNVRRAICFACIFHTPSALRRVLSQILQAGVRACARAEKFRTGQTRCIMTAVTCYRVALICAHRYTDAVGPVRAAQPAGSVGGSSSAVPATQFALPNPGIRHARGSMLRVQLVCAPVSSKLPILRNASRLRLAPAGLPFLS